MPDYNHPKLIERFWASLQKNEETGCWNWTGKRDKGGLPIIWKLEGDHSKEFAARRLSLMISGTDLSTITGCVFSRCGNQLCVNSDHLAFGTEARFWSKVDKTGDCWLWTSSRDKDEYGRITVNSVGTKTHIYSYELHIGFVPDGMMVCHSCDNPPCVRPDHLFLGTALDNNRDRNAKGRDAHGEGHGRAKLTKDDVIEARKIWCAGTMTILELADRYGVSGSTIHSAIIGQTWQHVK